jgi:carbon-monoxide dehydrogenase medium subunit
VRSAAPWISDPLVRNRGTLCGSVAHCDPEGDWNTVLLATGAEVMTHLAASDPTLPGDDNMADVWHRELHHIIQGGEHRLALGVDRGARKGVTRA